MLGLRISFGLGLGLEVASGVRVRPELGLRLDVKLVNDPFRPATI